jgi:uncharacterized membrane protein YecN with MAPEG domain
MYTLLFITVALLAFELASPWAYAMVGLVGAVIILARLLEWTGILKDARGQGGWASGQN